MKIRLNGKDYEVEKELSVGELLKRLDIHPQSVAVELNMKIIKKHQYNNTIVRDGDQVEIVSFVGGGCL